jgi:hypothetical protein
MDSWVLSSQNADRVAVRVEDDLDLANSRDFADFLDVLLSSTRRTELNFAHPVHRQQRPR